MTAGRLRFPTRWCLLPLMALGAAGCHTLPAAADRDTVSVLLERRTGQTLTASSPGELDLPPGVALEGELTEDAVVAVALRNNALFQELLVDLGLAQGDLVTAGLLPNPEGLYFFSVPNKPYKYAFEIPIEAIWLRPIRVRGAEREANRVADRLVQTALDLIRDTRQAFADTVLARERVRIAEEAIRLRGRIADVAKNRLEAGDATPQEAATARIDALQAAQDAARIRIEIPLAEERLRNLMGIPTYREPLNLVANALPEILQFDVDALWKDAVVTRPDAIAAREAIAAARARLDFARIGWVRLLGIGDASSGRGTGHEFGPALRFTLPVFNRNQGGIVRAEADLERLIRQEQTLKNQIVLDVQRAHLLYRQACAEIDVLRTKVRPEVERAIERGEAAFKEGNVNYLIVLETTRQLLDTMLREAILSGDLRRTWAELERSVGQRLGAIPSTPPGKSP